MNPADLICVYIYESFKVTEALMNVAVNTANMYLRKLNTFIDAIFSFCRYTLDVMFDTIINAIKVFQKYLVNLLWENNKEQFCINLYKCNIFIEQLLDPTSLIFRTLKSIGAVTDAQQTIIRQIVSDFDNFQATICQFGFTFNFGISAIKEILKKYIKWINEQLDWLYKKKESFRRQAQRYIDALTDLGIFDMLDKILKFTSCVLNNSELCASISTAKSFYKDTLRKLKIKENPSGGYKLDDSVTKNVADGLDKRTKEMNKAKSSLSDLIDEMMSPSQVNAAASAFDIASKIFPAGMTWTDVKKGRFKQLPAYHYFTTTADKLKEAFFPKKETEYEETITTEQLLQRIQFNNVDGSVTYSDEHGKVIKKYANEVKVDTEIEEGIPAEGEIEETSLTQETNTNSASTAFITESGKITSSLTAAEIMNKYPNSKLAQQIRKTLSSFSSMIPESELAKSW